VSRLVMAVMMVSCSVVIPVGPLVGADINTGEIEMILLEHNEIWDPTHSEMIKSYVATRELTTNQIRNVLIGMATNGLHRQDDDPRLQVLRERSVLVLRDYPGDEVSKALDAVATSTTDAALRRSAIRGVVCTSTHGLLTYVTRVVKDDSKYTASDRYALYVALFKRLQEGPTSIADSEKAEMTGFLVRQVASEKDIGSVMKLDQYLKTAEPGYRQSNERRNMVQKLAGSTAGGYKKYFSDELKSIE